MRLIIVCVLVLAGCSDAPPPPGTEISQLRAALATEAAADDPDDPAIWVNPADPARSLVLGTNKAAAPAGALLVFGLDGKLRQRIANVDRPNNVDVEYGLALGGERVDIAVLTERYAHRLLVYRIPPGWRRSHPARRHSCL